MNSWVKPMIVCADQEMRSNQSLKLSLLACLLIALLACTPRGDAPVDTPTQDAKVSIDFDAVSRVIIERLDLGPREKVLLVGEPGRFKPLVESLRVGAIEAEAEYLGAWAVEGKQPESWSTQFTNRIAESNAEDLVNLLASVDVSIMLPGADPEHAVYSALQDVLRSGHGRMIHFHWYGAYRPDGNVRSIDDEVDRIYERAVIATNYEELGAKQSKFEEAMRGATIRVTTGIGTDISFEIGDRPVIIQDGDASDARASRALLFVDREIELPAGAVRVAPVEATVNGQIVFAPSMWQHTLVERLTLTFVAGNVTALTASSGIDAVRAELDAAGKPGRAFREFALGFNPLLAIPDNHDRWIPYYGYGAGVVRLSLGDNSELGGKVGGGYIRWNFFDEATVTVDGETWVRNGVLVR